MFRRLQSGLPKDPVFANTLKGLGYYIHQNDEIRSIANPKAYFNFFITKNERYNVVQREGMNEAIRNIISDRLEALGLIKLRLPLDASESDRHLHIYISSNLKEKKEIIVLFYESSQDIGVFAHRVIGGKGGINVGSAVSLVQYVNECAAKAGKEAPGILLANMGQLYWSTRLKKALTLTSWEALPRKSAADHAFDYDERLNSVPGHKTPEEHLAYVFEYVLGNGEFCDQESKIHVLGVSEGALRATLFLHDKDNFNKWCKGINLNDENSDILANNTNIRGHAGEKAVPRVISLASCATCVTVAEDPEASNPEFLEITNPEFKVWFEDRGRVYVLSEAPLGQFIAPPMGRACDMIPAYGAPTFSLGESTYTERMLPIGHRLIIDWFLEITAGPHYLNPKLELVNFSMDDVAEEETEDVFINEEWAHGNLIPERPKAPELTEKERENLLDSVAYAFVEEGQEKKKPLAMSLAPVDIPDAATAAPGEIEAVKKLNNVLRRLNGAVEDHESKSKGFISNMDDMEVGDGGWNDPKEKNEGGDDGYSNFGEGLVDDFDAGMRLDNLVHEDHKDTKEQASDLAIGPKILQVSVGVDGVD